MLVYDVNGEFGEFPLFQAQENGPIYCIENGGKRTPLTTTFDGDPLLPKLPEHQTGSLNGRRIIKNDCFLRCLDPG